MTDYKNAPRYPVHAAAPEHAAHDRAANAIVIAALLIATAAIGGYVLGHRDAAFDAKNKPAASPVRVAQCPASNAETDVIEHSYAHRGTVFFRECLIVDRPNYVAPKYSAIKPLLWQLSQMR